MSNQAAIPAAIPYVSLQTGLRTLPTVAKDHSIYDSPSSVAGPWPVRGASLSALFISQEREESCVPARVFRSVSRLLFGHGFGAKPAPCGNSLFCFRCVALRVTVSLQILFGKYAEKISPEPP
jgi:hypothetical protein